MSLRRGSKVWVEDRDLAWALAEVADWKGKQLQVVTASGKKVLASPEKLFPRDADEDEHGGVDDMTKLTYLNEPGVLYNLQRRYALNDIYTYTGSILIAVNPFTKLPHLYNVHMMEQYKGAPFGELSPHVFAVADASYRAMMNDGRSQSILVSGESGAGKTETTKLIMQYLTYVGGRAAGAGDERTVEQQVLESNPLLEAFGNARTVRNDNSSRFGKFVEIQFDASGRISGAAIRTYLLERSRVVRITDPERNYHCFYQLCASGKDAEKYKLGHPSHFHYLNQSKTYELAGVSSAEEYTKTRTAMDIVGIGREDQEAIFRTLAAILHLGNIEFSPGKEHDSSVLKDQKSNFHMQMAANLFMCDVDLLLATLSTRTIQTREGIIVKALDCSGAISSRDALAKTVYSRLFDWLVDKINTSVGQDVTSQLQIGVLDIYGFECFKDNSFEQFCINFANEKLQQHFNEHVFKMEQEEYSKEEIDWSYIEFIDNQDVLDLIEKKPVGIIALLDEACMFPKSTHQSFSTRLFQIFRAHPRLEKAKFSETDFTMSHYAGKVTYHTDTFLDKNRDYVVVEHCNLLSSSKRPFVAGLFGSLPEESSRSSYKFSSVATRFKQQLQALMETLNSTEPHYIRCVKPNSLNQPQKFENLSILHQLRCGGVLEAVRISLAGYPTRRTYAEFIDRFGLLASEFIDGSYDEKSLTEKILKKLKLENFQLGRTKVFLRAGQIGVLDFRRAGVLDNAAKCIQRQLRTFVARKDFVSKRAAAFAIQAFCRGCLARALYTLKREAAAAILIQKHVQRWLLKCAYMELYSAATVIQSNIRGFSIRQRFLHGKKHKAATLIQARWRTCKVRSAFQHHQASVVAIQCLWRQKLARRLLRRLKQEANETGALRLAKGKLEKQLEDLTWRLQLEKRLRISNEEAKSIEISKLQKVLESLSLELDASKLATINECNKNAVLQNRLELSVKEKSSLEREIIGMAELRRESAFLKSSLDALDKKNSALETELLKARSDNTDTIQKLQEFEEKCNQLQQNVKSLEEKLLVLEEENLIMRLKALSVPAKSTRRGVEKSVPEKNSGVLVPITDQNPIFESPTPTKMIAPFSHGLPESRRSKLAVERHQHQENYEFLSRCVKEDLGFKDSKPLAACIIYKCLLQWHAFESERTVIFDHIIEGINDVLKVGDENITLPYWLSNASALLCLLQRNLRPNSFPATQRSGSSVLAIRIAQGLTSPFKYIGYEDGMSHLEARYPAILFKQQLTACVEKIFGLMRDNLKKELAPLLGSCIQAPKAARKSSISPGNAPQQLPGSQWDNIIKFLDTLMSRLRGNHVPSFFIRKLITQVFSFINMSLFNSLLLRRECCTFSNGEYVKSGLAELEKWIVNTGEEYAGTSWHELNYIRQAVGFLVIHQKRKKSLDEIRQDLCPALTVRQIYRISTMYWDDKYGTQSVSNEVVAQMRENLNKDNQNLTSNSFLLDDDLSIPFSTEDIDMAIPLIDPSEIELPSFLSGYICVQFLVQPQK
ncbi:myosin-15-like [Pyrus communis]|uniref:myosin-15-like n=1 Tax=Pyrus communis TaxID=23211 RepID=UPI0035C05910